MMPNVTVKDLKPGDILLSPPPRPIIKGWVGQLIVLLTGAETSHAALYCGEINGVHTIAHTYTQGTAHLSLRDHFEKDKTPYCHVRRHSTETKMDPVIHVANKYVEEKNPLLKSSFFLLSIVLLSKRLSENILRSLCFHRAVTMYCLKAIKAIQSRGEKKNMMTCSQFIMQCFEDAGDNYRINIESPFLEYERKSNLIDLKSLIDFVDPSEISKLTHTDENILSVVEEEWSPDLESAEEEEIVMSLIDLLKGGEQKELMTSVDDKSLRDNSTQLAVLVYEMLAGKKPEPGCDIEAFIFSNRNYCVSPEDLLKRTENLTAEGTIYGV